MVKMSLTLALICLFVNPLNFPFVKGSKYIEKPRQFQDTSDS